MNTYWKARKNAAAILRKIAGALHEDTTYRCFPAYYYYEKNKGLVIHQTDGVICGPVPGAPLYLREDEYDLAHRDT